MSPEAIRALVAAGVSAEQLAAAMLADAEVVATAKAAKRAKDAERKRNSRANVRDVTRTDAESSGQVVTPADPFLDKESPPDPQRKPNLSGECSSTRTREATDPPIPEKLAQVAVLRQAFQRFYAEYPRKKGPRAAEQAYARALGRIGTPDAPAVILNGLRRLLEGWATGPPEYVPHPATWLGRDGWNEESDTPRQPRLIHDRPGPRTPQQPSNGRAETRNAVWSRIAAEEDGPSAGRG